MKKIKCPSCGIHHNRWEIFKKSKYQKGNILIKQQTYDWDEWKFKAIDKIQHNRHDIPLSIFNLKQWSTRGWR